MSPNLILYDLTLGLAFGIQYFVFSIALYSAIPQFSHNCEIIVIVKNRKNNYLLRAQSISFVLIIKLCNFKLGFVWNEITPVVLQ